MYRLVINILIVVLLCNLNVGCIKSRILKNAIWKPANLDLDPPPGPEIYQQGWSDGCESGMSTYQNNFIKFMKVYKFRQDPVLRNNRMYYQVWKDAYGYCAKFLEEVNEKSRF